MHLAERPEVAAPAQDAQAGVALERRGGLGECPSRLTPCGKCRYRVEKGSTPSRVTAVSTHPRFQTLTRPSPASAKKCVEKRTSCGALKPEKISA